MTFDPEACPACLDYWLVRPHLTGACASAGLEHGLSTEETVRRVLAGVHVRNRHEEAA